MNHSIIRLECVDSTNVYLKSLCQREITVEGTVILADFQLNGKGQGLNAWHSTKGMNITMSMLFRPGSRAAEHFCISEFISLGIVDTLKYFKMESLIKWPNDIYVNDRKIAGILIENSILADRISQTIAGIGLNINEIDFPKYLPNPISMKMLIKKDIDRQYVLEILIANLIRRYNQSKTIAREEISRQYNELIFKIGQMSDFQSGDVSFRGTITKVENTGELIIQKENGQVGRYLHGEVSFRL